jgi:toxin ParE1/3/4
VRYQIVVTPEARNQLDDLHAHISAAADTGTAADFTDALLDQIGTLNEFPRRGTPRDDLRPGLRTIAWRRRVTVAYVVEDAAVVVIGVFYAGRDFESLIAHF